MDIELPRHVKKIGGLWKRVNTPAELDAALADGWVLRLSDAPRVAPVSPVVEADVSGPSDEPVLTPRTWTRRTKKP